MKHRSTHHGRRRRGLIVTDAVIGLGIAATLLVIIATASGHDRRTARAAEQHRELTFEAEAALLALRLDQPPPTAEDPATAVTVNAIDHTDTPDGYAWVRAVATREGQRIELTGLIPADASDRLPYKHTAEAPAPAEGQTAP